MYPEPVNIIDFKNEHAPALSEIILRNFFEVNIKDYPLCEMKELSRKYTPENIMEFAGFRDIFVALRDGKPVGSLSVDASDSVGCHLISMVFVDPGCHGMGIGRLLMEAGERHIREIGGRTAILTASITAHGFYKKLGYKYSDGDSCPNEQGCYVMYKELG